MNQELGLRCAAERYLSSTPFAYMIRLIRISSATDHTASFGRRGGKCLGLCADEYVIERAAKRVYVAFDDSLAAKLFWRDVSLFAYERSGCLSNELVGGSEIDHHDAAVLGDYKVVRRQVAVNDWRILLVQILQNVGDFYAPIDHNVFLLRTVLSYELSDILPVQILQHQVSAPAFDEVVEHF